VGVSVVGAGGSFLFSSSPLMGAVESCRGWACQRKDDDARLLPKVFVSPGATNLKVVALILDKNYIVFTTNTSGWEFPFACHGFVQITLAIL